MTFKLLLKYPCNMGYKLLTVSGDTGYKNVTEKGRRTWNF
nr:MAG TPA: hypothetical protein [Caudoviricetes sp.]